MSRSLSLTRERGKRGFEAYALRLLADIASRPDLLDVEMVEGHYRQAIELAGQLGMRPLLAHCHLGLGKVYRRTGKLEQAREHLIAATGMYPRWTCRSGWSRRRPRSRSDEGVGSR